MKRKPHAGTPTEISSVIGRALAEFGLTEKVRQYTAVDLWSRVVGEQIAKMTEAEKIIDGRLFVKVANAVWRNELVFHKKDLIAKLNAALQETIVTDIVFK
jgi:predicted nucleic acid-binding Zn ribbon protein